MTKKLNSMPDYQARMPRQPHDVGQSTAYTTCPGMLSPVYFDMLHTGDELHFSASQYTRFNPLQTKALGQIDVHLDYFFVPLTVMYTPASSLFYQTDDLVTSLIDQTRFDDNSSFPYYDFQGFLNMYSAATTYPSRPWFDDVASSRLPAAYFDCVGKSIYRIFDFLDMDPTVLTDSIVSGTPVQYYPDYTPWFALAYQAIYQLYFRNDDREYKNYHYNIDQYYAQGNWFEDPGSVKTIFNMNYCSRPKDYFNSVKVSPLASSVSLLRGNTSIDQIYSSVNSFLYGLSTTVLNSNPSPSPLGSLSTSVGDVGTVSTSAIRQIFMVEKLLRVLGRAEKNYESQFLAHYGIKIPHDVMHNITHIGHDMLTLSPEAIESTANTYNSGTGEGSALGEIGGTCAGMLSGTKKNFKAPFHGVFMVISHVVPRKRYVLGLNKLHQLNSPSDFWQPEFDRKGMQPLFKYEAYRDFNVSTAMTSREGWQFAYEQFKRKSDRVMGAFYPTTNSANGVNTYAPWVISGYPYSFIDSSGAMSIPSVADAISLLVSPNDFNINMIVPHQVAWPTSAGGVYWPWMFYNSDPLICDFNMKCKKVNMMSEYGEPEL